MADTARAEELVQTIDRDETFRSELEAVPTMGAKRRVLDAHGFQDVTLDDMRAYVESYGGQLVMQPSNRELSEEELSTVVGGDSSVGAIVGGSIVAVVGVAAFFAVAAG
ncbi:MAG TPA: hypothetical protein VF221_00910 [Chloroflexota bacterium]